MNAVVIAAHGCPTGCLGPYGNEWAVTPALDRLAAEGVVFDRHYAARPDPLAARREWWKLQTPSPPTPLPQGERGAIIRASRPAFDAPPDYYARFAEVFDARPESDAPFAPLLRLLPAVLDKLAKQSDWLLWIETDRLLPPWHAPGPVFEAYCEDLMEDADPDAEPLVPWADPPVGWFDRDDLASWELLHRSFATAVTALDADLEQLFDLLRDRGLDRTAAWAFTSDFGYPLGEHGIVGPFRPWLHEEFVHLPLIVRYPEAKDAGRRVWGFTQPGDLLSIVPLAPGGQGTGGVGGNRPPLTNVVRGQVVTQAEIAGHREASLRTDTHALLLPLAVPEDEPREPLLYEKPDDRWELNDVRQPNLDLADEMAAEVRERIGEPAPGGRGGG
jgi:arylsulfatase A-like enzyme